jgi:tetratricopeptide (TPR) repeat protein
VRRRWARRRLQASGFRRQARDLKPELLLALVGIACAHGRAEPQRIEITEPAVITAGPPQEVPLGEMDDATLFDVGTRAFQAGDFEKAVLHFDRLWTSFPSSSNRPAALWNAALARERLGQFAAALERFEKYIELKNNEPDAQLHAALAEYRLGQLPAAAQRLHALAARPGLPALTRAKVMVQEAVCRIEGGSRAEGEHLLRSALDIYENDREERIDPALPAQAEFWLGEVFRGASREERLDPLAMDQKALGDALEKKAQLLLSAQGHYLRSIRRGDGEWATAAGYRIGEMYEELYAELVQAPLPRGLNESQRALYQEQLRKRVKNLVEKAIRIYEQTLSTAQRVGAQTGYVEKIEQALDRLRKLLLPN